MDTNIDKPDFQFHGLQKCRLYPSNAVSGLCRDAICVSSLYQIGVAASGDNQLVAFPSSAIHKLHVTKHTTNAECSSLAKKTVQLAPEDKITGLGINSDGTLLAVLVTNSAAGAFVHIFDVAAFASSFTGEVYRVSSIRLGMSPTAAGVCVKWNPALPDTLAASSSDKDLIVAKVDVKNPAVYSILAARKVAAVVTQISWSPKGKQLTTGDELGKICQLKMELEVVRSTMPPELLQPNAAVTGLCWISTTEWLVAYAGQAADTCLYLLTLKKDQPVSWRPFPEVQYGSAASTLPHQLSFETILLLPWNLVIVTSSKSSEVFVIGKAANDWKVWNLDEETRLDLPTDATTRETFPVGLAVDLSSSESIFLDEERTKPQRAGPILYVLTTDGVLTAHNVVSFDASHIDCKIEPTTVTPSSVRVGKRPDNIQPAPSVQPTPASSLFGGAAQPAPASSLFGGASGSQPSPASSLFGGTAQTVPATATPQAPVSSLFGGNTSTGQPFKTQTGTVPKQLFQPQASSTPKVEEKTPRVFNVDQVKVEATPTATPVREEQKKEQDLTADVEAVNRAAAEAIRSWSEVADNLRALSIGMSHTEDALLTAAESAPSEDDFRMLELFRQTFYRTEETYQQLESLIEELVATATAKKTVFDRYADDEERMKALLDGESFDTDEKMKRLTLRLDDVKGKYAEGKKLLTNLKVKRHAPLLKATLSVEDCNLVRENTKNMAKWMKNLTNTLEAAEDDYKLYKLAKLKSQKAQRGVEELAALEIKLFQYEAVAPRGFEDAKETRKKMFELFKRQAPPAIRTLQPLPFATPTVQTEEQLLETKKTPFDNLKESLLTVMLNSPRKSTASTPIKPAPLRSDASTQIDQPPQIKIIEKEVPVPTPPRPVIPATPPVVKPAAPSGFVLPTATPPSSIFTPATVTILPTTPKSQERPPLTQLPGVATPIIPSAAIPKVEEELSPVPKTPVKEPISVATPPPVEKKAPLTAKPSIFPGSGEQMTPTKPATSIFAGGLTTPPAAPIAAETLPVKTEEKKEEEVPTASFTFGLKPKEEAVPAKPEEKKEEQVEKTPLPAASTAPTAPATTAPAQSIFSFKQQSAAAAPEPVKPPASTFSFGNKPAATSSVFGGVSATTAEEKPKASIFGGGGATADTSTKSIFGGGEKTQSAGGAFGAFSTPQQQPAAAPTFSFKPKETSAAAAAPSAAAAPTFSFAPKPSAASSGFMAAAKAAAEDGMMEEDAGGAAQSAFGSFGSFSIGGGGSSSAASNPSKNIFSSDMGQQPQQQQKPSSFGLFSQQPQKSGAFGSFGAAAAATAAAAGGTKPSIFGGAAGGQSQGSGLFGGGAAGGGGGQTKSIFGGGFSGGQQAQQQQTSGSSPFNTSAPKFGAAPVFGGAAKQTSIFGGKPAFPSSPAGTGTAPAAGGGFAKYAGSGNLFAAGASSSQQQQQGQSPQSGSIFQWR